MSTKAASKPIAAIEKLREACKKRGVCGIKMFGRTFRLYDDDRNRRLDMDEFANGAHDYGVVLTQPEIRELFATLDTDGSGTISFDEFLIALRPPMSRDRVALIEKAFAKLDSSGDGVVTVDDLNGVYNVKFHPKHKSGEWTKEQVLQEFLSTFDVDKRDYKITKEEFINYYAGVSASIDKDVYFDLMMRQAWNL